MEEVFWKTNNQVFDASVLWLPQEFQQDVPRSDRLRHMEICAPAIDENTCRLLDKTADTPLCGKVSELPQFGIQIRGLAVLIRSTRMRHHAPFQRA